MKNIWRIADDLTEKYEKRNTLFDDIEDFDDLAIANLFYEPLDELLSGCGITRKQALSEEAAERRSYDELAKKLGIKTREFPWIWIELIKQCESCPTEDHIKFLLWLTAGGSFAGADDELTTKEANEVLIRQWIRVNKRMAELKNHLFYLKKSVPEFAKILADIDRIKTVHLGTANDLDVDRVFSVIRDNVSDTNFKKDLLCNNLMAISQIIDKYDFLKPIKPLVYFQAYVRQNNKLLNKVFSPDLIKKMFESKAYKIFENNGKNFEQYAEFCLLYVLLKDCFPDADEKLCDMGFICCSNLTDWYHDLGYLGYSCDLPDGIPITTYALVRDMSVFCFDKSIYSGNNENLEKWSRQYQNLNMEVINAVDEIQFEELGEFAENGTGYCEKFFSEKIKNCIKNEDQHKAAWGLLVRETERRFDELLEQKICDILEKYYLKV